MSPSGVCALCGDRGSQLERICQALPMAVLCARVPSQLLSCCSQPLPAFNRGLLHHRLSCCDFSFCSCEGSVFQAPGSSHVIECMGDTLGEATMGHLRRDLSSHTQTPSIHRCWGQCRALRRRRDSTAVRVSGQPLPRHLGLRLPSPEPPADVQAATS